MGLRAGLEIVPVSLYPALHTNEWNEGEERLRQGCDGLTFEQRMSAASSPIRRVRLVATCRRTRM